MRDSTICVAKTKALISFAVTAKLVCAFVFTYMQIVGFLMQWIINKNYTLPFLLVSRKGDGKICVHT